MQFLTRIIGVTVTAVATAMLLSCSKHSEYTADYATFDSIPYNVETNVRATTSVIKTYPGSYMFKSEYPQYDATVNFGLVTVSDSAKIAKVIKISLTAWPTILEYMREK